MFAKLCVSAVPGVLVSTLNVSSFSSLSQTQHSWIIWCVWVTVEESGLGARRQNMV